MARTNTVILPTGTTSAFVDTNGLVELAKIRVSGAVSSITFSSVLSDRYENYLLIGGNIRTDTGSYGTMSLIFNNALASDFSTAHSYGTSKFANGSNLSGGYESNIGRIDLAQNTYDNTGFGINMQMSRIYYNSTYIITTVSQTTASQGYGAPGNHQTGGRLVSGSAPTGFRIDQGNTCTAGVFTFYGYTKVSAT